MKKTRLIKLPNSPQIRGKTWSLNGRHSIDKSYHFTFNPVGHPYFSPPSSFTLFTHFDFFFNWLPPLFSTAANPHNYLHNFHIRYQHYSLGSPSHSPTCPKDVSVLWVGLCSTDDGLATWRAAASSLAPTFVSPAKSQQVLSYIRIKVESEEFIKSLF